ncbi:hypothetical protein BAUCODRAFT_386066 [Baudoinia panamericana UAMH 10762]|uniref:Uncharacterized protein n=1 Tax=Baudoinia panamericana (strain UAMH 10762) TaxID=717646 RepID=M2NHX2_BAUPA|nr:uncharacterized protein BAUCODRAFT_386066 [Baudoinia panamericana UAMH 10762]EMC98954.1 hypothetical protein BAUCODRAFT_386066 [Baudoinia panamericana UAMH 10762]
MASEVIQSFLAAYEQSAPVETDDPTSIPAQPLTCCCGNEACAYSRQNRDAVEILERDVRTAARLGQALLLRHETYIADTERERKIMAARIDDLESEKQVLERENASVIQENRNLLDELEGLNSAVSDADAHVISLQATLQSTQQEMQRLERLAARTETLEQQLQAFEQEQADWQTTFEEKEEGEKAALRRWQESERALALLQEQVELIERDAKAERERHVEVVGRLEKRRAVERELESATGRLKGAAAAKTEGGTNVVSHFVKDILQDNANLQMGIVELREMLQNSNDEVDSLRKQIMEQQPTMAEEAPSTEENVRTKDLREELLRANSQELHVHHHYHAPPSSARQTPTLKRPKKKRYGALTPGHFTPPSSGRTTPRSSISYDTPSSMATILQQTAVSIPQNVSFSKRFSSQSTSTYHSALSISGPGSPQSTNYRTSSIFDRVFSDAGHESSRPTTPDTDEPGSPLILPTNGKGAAGNFHRSSSAPLQRRRGTGSGAGQASIDSVLGINVGEALQPTEHTHRHNVILEEDEASWENTSSPPGESISSTSSALSDDLVEPLHHRSFHKQSLRRAASHESLLSVAGMDMPTLQARPSQLLISTGGTTFTPQATLAHATRTAATFAKPSSSGHTLLSGMAADQRGPSRPSLGRWVFGRWGTTPIPTSATDTTNVAAVPAPAKPPSRSSDTERAPAFDPLATPKKPKSRPRGINQLGPIPGLGPELRAPVQVPVLRTFDEEGLRLALQGS